MSQPSLAGERPGPGPGHVPWHRPAEEDGPRDMFAGGTVNLGRRCERDRWERGRVTRELSMPRGGPARELPAQGQSAGQGPKAAGPTASSGTPPLLPGSPSHCLLAPW